MKNESTKKPVSIVPPFSGDTIKKFLLADSAYNSALEAMFEEKPTKEKRDELARLRQEREKLAYILAEDCF